ncbi:MAG: HlyD family efflux transporter periplasmic adaptor subunit, partial [Clostridiales bacterium]|nr:HlyD family efflux transporter periplasmic adaptor subunit [Clostridiales bacterium]
GTETSTETVGTADAATTGSAPAAAELSELAAARLAQRTAASAAPSLEIRALDHGTLAFRSDLTVKSLGTGTVANVLVKENDYVKEGQLLIELTNSDTSYAYTRELNALKMESLETQLEATRETLDYYVIYAPIDGMFVSQPVSENDYIEINQVVCTIIDPQSLEFVTDVDELDIDKVSLGQRVEVSFDALSDTALRPITGEVKKIAIEGASSGGVTTYGVTVGVEASDRIKAGMNADGLIYIQSKTDVITIPVEAVTIMGGGNRAFVYVKDEGAAGAGAADGTGAETAGAGEGGAPGTDVVGGVGGAPGAGAGDVNTGGINTADATTTADAPGVNATDETGGVPGADAATRPSGQRGMPPQGFDAADASGRPSRPSGAWAGAGRNPGDPGGIPGAAAMTTPAASSETAEASSAPSDETAEASSSSASSSETAEASSASSNAAETGSAPLDTPAPAPALAPAPSDAFPSNGTGQVFSGRRGVTIVDGASGTGYYEGAVIRVVEIGISNDSSIEIVSGLSEGEAVVLPATIGAAATSAAQGAIPAQGGGMVQFAAPAGGANMGGGNRTFLGGG